MESEAKVPYNKAVFMTTHNSYSPKIGASIEAQLNSRIYCIELDIHNPNIEHTRHFEIGHLRAGEGVYHKEGNPTTIIFEDWLRVIRKWSETHADHEPVTLFIDIKGELTEKHPESELLLLNQTIHDIFPADKLYRPEDFIKYNNNQLTGMNWPSVMELRSRIIIVLTGNSQSKWNYWKRIPLQEMACFISYTYPDDGKKKYSHEMLEETKIVNTAAKHWRWASNQSTKGKIVRLFQYNPRSYPLIKHIKFPLGRWTRHKCNFPATDHPFNYLGGYRDWYKNTCLTLQTYLKKSA